MILSIFFLCLVYHFVGQQEKVFKTEILEILINIYSDEVEHKAKQKKGTKLRE